MIFNEINKIKKFDTTQCWRGCGRLMAAIILNGIKYEWHYTEKHKLFQ